MFRKTSGQLSLFNADNFFPEALPLEDWSYIFRDEIYPLIDEDKFKDFYKTDNSKGGQPNKSIKTIVSILIFMEMEKLTWRNAEYQFPRRLDWLIATNTPLGEASIDQYCSARYLRESANN